MKYQASSEKSIYARMEILRLMSKLTKSVRDKNHIYKKYIRSVLEQSSVVWSSSITKKNKSELEKVQKVAVRIIYNSNDPYKDILKKLNLETLQVRRVHLSSRFSDKCVKNVKSKSMIKPIIKEHKMKLGNKEKYIVRSARTVRLHKSAIYTITKHMYKKYKDNKMMLGKLTTK